MWILSEGLQFQAIFWLSHDKPYPLRWVFFTLLTIISLGSCRKLVDNGSTSKLILVVYCWSLRKTISFTKVPEYSTVYRGNVGTGICAVLWLKVPIEEIICLKGMLGLWTLGSIEYGVRSRYFNLASRYNKWVDISVVIRFNFVWSLRIFMIFRFRLLIFKMATPKHGMVIILVLSSLNVCRGGRTVSDSHACFAWRENSLKVLLAIVMILLVTLLKLFL